jgi:hypothetical protein
LKKLVTLAWFSLLFACASDSNPTPSDANAYVLPGPSPIVGQSQFVQLFKDLCLTSPNRLADFESAARQFGLKHRLKADRLRLVYEVNEWSSAKDPKESALEVSVGWSETLYLIEGETSGLPSRGRSCSVTAYLPELSDGDRDQLVRITDEELRPIAKALSFNAYTENYSVTPDDIGLTLTLSEKTRVVASQDPIDGCPLDSTCWSTTPYRLKVGATIERIQ